MAIVAVGGVLAVGLIAAMVIFGAQQPRSSTSPSPSLAAGASLGAHATPWPSGSPSQSAVASPTARPTGSSAPSGSPTATPGQTPPPSASVTPTPAGSIAPQSAADFDLQNQVIAIAFPLRANTEYRYRDNWFERRAGPPDPYNHAVPRPDGTLMRRHDGIDIYAPQNEPVLAPFDGTVIDPQQKWIPWEPDRYGLTVVVQSDEPGTTGYTAVLVHLDRVWVDIGQHVTRGQVIGVLGRTGNAEDVRPQLHFELRAPFLIDWTPIGEARQVDAFNPYPSLTAADPKT